MSMDEEKGKFQFSGLKFLYDMELVDDPQLINNLKLNIFSVAPYIRDADLLSSYHHKSMLIWLDVNWLGRTFFEKRIVAGVSDRAQQLLPNFRFRVTTNRAIFDLALQKVKLALTGENNEVPRMLSSAVLVDAKPSESAAVAVPAQSDLLQDKDPKSES